MLETCLNHLDWFCFICENFTCKEEQKNITHDIKKMCSI